MPTYAHTSTNIVANDCKGSGKTFNDSIVTDTDSPRPKYIKPIDKAKYFEN